MHGLLESNGANHLTHSATRIDLVHATHGIWSSPFIWVSCLERIRGGGATSTYLTTRHHNGGSRISQTGEGAQPSICYDFVVTFLPPANEVCEGCVFTRVCHSVHGGGTWAGTPQVGTLPGQVHPPGQVDPRQVPLLAGTPQQVHPPGRYPLGRYTPRPQCMLGYGQQAGGTHPTGMHYCYCLYRTKILLLDESFKVQQFR